MGLPCCDGQAAAVANRNCQAAAVAFAEKACMLGRSHTLYTYIYIHIHYIISLGKGLYGS